jgi:hypothetical protein
VAVGLTTGGILGALLAPPIVASFRVIGSYVHAKLLDYPPFGGKLLDEPKPRTYHRTVTRRDLEKQRALEKKKAEKSLLPEEKATTSTPVSGKSKVDSQSPTRPTSSNGAELESSSPLIDQAS